MRATGSVWDMRTGRGEYKVPGGKLVAVNVTVDDDGRVVGCRIDGDFFVEAESDRAADALITDIERCLVVGEPVEAAIARHPGVRLVGCDAAAIGAAFRRAMSGVCCRRRCDENGHAGEDGRAGGHPGGDIGTHAGGDEAASGGEDVDFAARWERLWPRLEIVHDVPRSPAEQMTVDERWAREVASGGRRPTLRIWEWSGSCVVVGRFQSVPDEVHEDVAHAEGIGVVRRCTGGGAMFIEPGNTITYSLYAPMWFVDGLDVTASYRLCDRWLVGALKELGLDVRFSGLNDIASSHGKIGGAAQRRFPAVGGRSGRERREGLGTDDVPGNVNVAGDTGGSNGADDDGGSVGPDGFDGTVGSDRSVGRDAPAVAPGAVLHHVTMAYDIDAGKMGRVLNTSREKLRDKAVRSAVKRVDPLKSQTGMTRDEVVDHLLAYLRGRGRRPDGRTSPSTP